MEVISIRKEDMSIYGKTASGVVFSVIVKITNIKGRAKNMIEMFSNTSWIDKLGAVEKASFEATSKRTRDRLVNDILAKVDDAISTEFGEYMVSDTAQCVLESHLKHTKVPLAELLKEKVSGNPGFDFHTESSSNLIAFGEAKYSGSSNPHANAIGQVVEFIELNKDIAELIIIKNFVSETAVNNSLSGKKAYVAAFSINSTTPNKIMINALKSDLIDSLLEYPELYLVGVNVDAR